MTRVLLLGVLLDVGPARQGGRVTGWRFVELPTRPLGARAFAVKEVTMESPRAPEP